jgi:PII-like signaling protein
MLRDQAGKILGIHISEADRYREKPLYEAIVEKCRELHIAGATVFRGLEGYGETGELHTAHLVWHEQPIVIAIVDSAESLARLVPAVEEMMYTGLIAESDVRVTRVERNSPGRND